MGWAARANKRKQGEMGPGNGRPMGVNLPPVVAPAIDRFGAPIRKGSKLLYRSAVDLVFEVVDVQPMMDPRVPVGSLRITLAASPFPVMVAGGRQIMEMIQIATAPQPAEDPADAPAEPLVTEQ